MYKQSLQKQPEVPVKQHVHLTDSNWHAVTSKLTRATHAHPNPSVQEHIDSMFLSGCLMNLHRDLKDRFEQFGFMDTSHPVEFIKQISSQITLYDVSELRDHFHDDNLHHDGNE